MPINEYRVEYSVWSIMASNLILGADLRGLKDRHPECLALILNKDIIGKMMNFAVKCWICT